MHTRLTSSSQFKRRSQAGQSTVEWSGITVLVAAAIAALLVFTGAIGGQVGHGAVCEVKKVFGRTCTASASTPSNEVVCEVASDTRKATENIQVLFLTGEHDATLIKTVYSDGHVTYTVVQSGQLEAQYKLFQAEAEIGDAGFDAEVAAAAGGQLTGSETFSFPNQQAAKAFEDEAQSTGGWGEVLHDGAGPIGGWILDRVGVHGAPTEGSLAQQYGSDLTSQYVSVGAVASVTGKVGAQAGPVGAQLQDELNGAGGARYITAGPQKGDVQLYLQLGGSTSASVLAGEFGDEINAKGSGTAVVTLGPDGQPLSLQLSATGQVGATGSGTAKSNDKDDDSGDDDSGSGEGGSEEGESGNSELGISAALTSGEGVQYTANLNLQNNPAAVQGLVDLLGGDTGQGASALAQQIQSNGTQQLQPFQDASSKTGLSIAGEVSDVGGGFGTNVNNDNQQYSPGWIAVPGQGWQSVVCKK